MAPHHYRCWSSFMYRGGVIVRMEACFYEFVWGPGGDCSVVAS